MKPIKILFATTPAAGHFNPLTGLAEYLAQRGNDVRWYTSSDFSRQITELSIHHYPFKAALGINFENLDAFFPERVRIKNPTDRMNFDMINLFANRSTEYFSDISEIFQKFKFDVLICDNTFSAIPIIRAKLNIPVVAIGVMPLPEISIDLGPYGLGLLPPLTVLGRLKNNIMRYLFKNLLAKKSISAFANILAPFQIPDTRLPLLDLLVKKSDLFLQIGTQSFEYPRSDLGKNIRFIGGLKQNAPKGSFEFWFDQRLTTFKKIILITQGTVEKNLNNLIIPTIEAFKGGENLLIVTTGGNQTETLQQRYKFENIIIEDFIPYKDIMPYAHVYVTNGGYGGVMQSLNYGLPIVAAGLFEGKNEICSRIGYFKVGINLKTETPSIQEIRTAVNKILTDTDIGNNAWLISNELDKINSKELCYTYIKELLTASDQNGPWI